MAPVVTFNHFTSPHWFAMRGSWLDPEAPALFARYCDTVMERFGDRIAIAVTMNEPNLTRLLSWIDLPDVRARPRAGHAGGGDRGDRRTRLSAGQRDAPRGDGRVRGRHGRRATSPARRPSRPAAPTSRSGCRWRSSTTSWTATTPRCATASAPRSTSAGWSWPGTTTSSGCRTTSASRTTATVPVAPPAGTPLNQMGSAIEPLSLGGSVRYAHEATGVPVLVTEHGMSTADDTLRAAFIEPSLAGLLDVMESRGAGARLPALDADGQLRVGLRLRPPARPARGRPRDLRAYAEAEREQRSRREPLATRGTGDQGDPALETRHPIAANVSSIQSAVYAPTCGRWSSPTCSVAPSSGVKTRSSRWELLTACS